MEISVCIPTYNRPRLLQEAVLSAYRQVHRPAEILVGDDSKDDAAAKMLNELDLAGVNLLYFKNEPPLGQARNVQNLFQKCSSPLISLLHDDDRYRPGALAILQRPFAEYAAIAATFGKQMIISEGGDENPAASASLNATYHRTAATAGLIPNSLEAGALQIFPNNGYLVRREVAQAIDYYADGRASTACDFYFGFRLGRRGRPFYFCDAFTADYRETRQSIARLGSDAGFYAMKILTEELRPEEITPLIAERLRMLVKIAIAEGTRRDRAQCWRWFFSQYHRKSIATPGGIKRLLNLLRP
jgi:glycosyltransferase involved in cell wall biosynthesis